MSNSRPFHVPAYIESVSPLAPRVAPKERSAQVKAVDGILMHLALLDAPFVTPTHVASKLGLSPAGVRYHCRNCRALKGWSGSYRFFMDDEGHVAALRAMVSLAVHSVQSLPEEYQVKVH